MKQRVNAQVWTPDVEHTSTTRSLFPIKSGIAIPCTGVVRVKFKLRVKSRIHDDNSGVSASKDLGCFLGSASSSAMSVARRVLLAGVTALLGMADKF